MGAKVQGCRLAPLPPVAPELIDDRLHDRVLEIAIQLRLHALDALAERLTAAGRYSDATSAALAAVRAEPLRETAHAALINVYIAEGNRAEALAAYERYCALLQSQMALRPTPRMEALVKDLKPS